MGTFPDLKNKSVELAAMAKQIAKDRNISYVEALLAIGRENPEFVTNAYEDVLGRIVRETTCGWPGHQVTITDIGIRLSEMARERAKEKNIPFAAALSEIGREFPRLAAAHRQQVLGKRSKALATSQGEAQMKQKWSTISQRARLEIARLEGELEKCKGLIFWHEEEVKRGQEICAHQTRLAVSGHGIADIHMGSSLHALENMRRHLACFKEHATGLKSKIDALARPTAEQAAQRAEKQSRLAKVAAARLEKDRLIERALQDLRRLLGERSQLTASMAEAASAVDFTFVNDGLDEDRFKTLLDVLPSEIAATSESRTAAFFGEEETHPYVVRIPELVLAETLASCHVYHAGDQVLLTEKQAHELTGHRAGGAPVMTVADHEAKTTALAESPIPA